jgi:hypothetical protein
VVKTETVLECATKEQRGVLRVMCAEGLKAKDNQKEMFPGYGGKCLPRRPFKTGSRDVANVSLMTKRLKWSAEVTETTVKRLLC